jgi:alkanesulfonate monooxygenase SsuD/methylene tetrahydromethanopterin reductase-like flavin-dependent oxidoreductase (luciferase family)
MKESRARFFAGSPQTVRKQLANLAERCGTHEIMITTMIHDHAERRHSYELLAEAFGISVTPRTESTSPHTEKAAFT